MKNRTPFLAVMLVVIVLVAGCATTKYSYQEPAYTQAIEKGSVLREFSLESSLEEKILAMNPERVSDQEVREVLSRAPAPRIVNIHGGIYPVHLCMISFSEFLIGMGYPENRIRSPGDGSFSFSCYDSSETIAGAVAWYYEKEGLRPIIVGHSQGGIQAVKVLHQLAGDFSEKIAVWNPLTGRAEDRYSIIDPITGHVRTVVGLQVSYATAVGAGGFTRFLPNQWVMVAKLRSIPDTTVEFTGFSIGMDLLGGDLLGFGSANQYAPNGKAEVRNVRLPVGYNHVTVPVTAHLAESQETKDWINGYIPVDEPELTDKLKANTSNILWAADVWYSIKKHWVLELQRLILAKRNMTHAH